MSEFKLIEQIIAKSKSQTWDMAKLEWDLVEIDLDEDASHCLCGHYPIKEICKLKNKETNEIVEVGNFCVKKFETGMHKIIPSLKKIQVDKYCSVNVETIEYAFVKKLINDWEHGFYIDTWRKRNLSAPQMDKRIQINKKLLILLN